MSRFRVPRAKVIRDVTLFLFGIAGLTYETLAAGAEKPTLIIAFAGLLSAPAFIRGDERYNRNHPNPPDPPTTEREQGPTP